MLDSKSSTSDLLFKDLDDTNNTDDTNNIEPKTYTATPLSRLS
jgi:hypothetical protein